MNSLLPSAVQDKNNLALEKCAKEILDIDVKKIMIYPIENTQESLLPILAKENHILPSEGWELAQTKEQKQKLLTSSLILHSKKGSIPSIIEALNTLGIIAQIKEGKDYNARPSHFKVEFLNLFNRELTDKLEQQIKEIINSFKPATRKLDIINYFLCSKGQIYYWARIKTNEFKTIKTKEVIL